MRIRLPQELLYSSGLAVVSMIVAFAVMAAKYQVTEIPDGNQMIEFSFPRNIQATITVPRGAVEETDFEVNINTVSVKGIAFMLDESKSPWRQFVFPPGKETFLLNSGTVDAYGELRLTLSITTLENGRPVESLIYEHISKTVPFVVVPSLRSRLTYFLMVFAVLFGGLVGLRRAVQSRRSQEEKLEQKVERAESKAQAEPEKARYAWDVARINLEAYFERNRTQVSQVFIIALVVMTVGFVLVGVGVVLAMHNPKEITPPLVAGISGIITQFIGATFMVIYRSTMTQANEFMVVLERINTVGMAVQVLDSIPESEVALKNSSRAKIVELLLSANVSTSKLKGKRNKIVS